MAITFFQCAVIIINRGIMGRVDEECGCCIPRELVTSWAGPNTADYNGEARVNPRKMSCRFSISHVPQ